MKLTGKSAGWKIATLVGVGLLVLADIILGVVFWQVAREAPDRMAANRNQLQSTAAQYDAELARLQRIRAELNHVGKNSQDFYETSFLDSRTVYSTVDSDIASIASKAGVKTAGFTFKPTNVPNRSVSELDINMTVDGDYSSLLKFINGIERSKNFYFLNQLQLAEAGPTGIRLQLELHTYYRT
jgi:Tfp pilus assembly protein PilO